MKKFSSSFKQRFSEAKILFLLPLFCLFTGTVFSQSTIIYNGLTYNESGVVNGKPQYCKDNLCTSPPFSSVSVSKIYWDGTRWREETIGSGGFPGGWGGFFAQYGVNNEDTPTPPCSADYPWAYAGFGCFGCPGPTVTGDCSLAPNNGLIIDVINAGTPAMTGTYTNKGTLNGKDRYCLNGDCSNGSYQAYWTGFRWNINRVSTGFTLTCIPGPCPNPDVYSLDDTPQPPCTPGSDWFANGDPNNVILTNLTVSGDCSINNQAPVASCQNISVDADAICEGNAVATDFDNASMDPDGDPLSYSLDISAPYTFGITSIVLTVTDPSGASDDCTASITVSDVTAPNTQCQNVTANLDASGNANITSADIDNGTTDNCSNANLSLSGQVSYTCADLDNTYTVTLHSDDGNGNSSSCTADVLVSDDNLPDADCDGVSDICDVCPGGDDSVDNNGDGIADCSQLLNYNDYSAAWKCQNNKIEVNHNGNTICINKNALSAHFNHGDYVGPAVSCSSNRINNSTIDFGSSETHRIELEVFPNPATDEVNIHLHGMETKSDVMIFDLTGKMVFSQKVNEDNSEINLNVNDNRFSNGVYMVRMVSKELSLTKRLVIQK